VTALGPVRVVLVETRIAANLGATARVLKNMGIERLALVAPRARRDRDARALAVGAEDVLESARRVATLDEALEGAALVAGASGRESQWNRAAVSPGELADLYFSLHRGEELALVFGPEDRGLRARELDRCRWLVRIPTAGKPSLNLSHAVLVLTYELLRAATRPVEAPPAGPEDVHALIERLAALLRASGFLKPDDPRRLPLKLDRFLRRAAITQSEVRTAHAALKALEAALERVPG
jgi:TrmH family RNA methyltransferase